MTSEPAQFFSWSSEGQYSVLPAWVQHSQKRRPGCESTLEVGKIRALDSPHAKEAWRQELLDLMGNSKIEADEEPSAQPRPWLGKHPLAQFLFASPQRDLI